MLEMTDKVIVEVQKNQQVDDEKKWCVYCHTCKSNGKKYFGITSRNPEDRWNNGYNYGLNTIFRKAINKYTWNGFEHEIVLDGLTEFEAKQKEVELIALFKTNCLKYQNPAFGYNMTDGGDGTVGCYHTDEWKKQHSDAMSGENNPSYGKTIKERLGDDNYEIWLQKQHARDRTGINNPMYGVSPQERMDENTYAQWIEHKRASMTGENNHNYGVPMSEEQKRKISEAKSGKKLTEEEKAKRRAKASVKTPVYCFELDAYFKSAADAERNIGACARTILNYCNGDPTRKSAGKCPLTGVPLHWRKASVAEYNDYINNIIYK